MAETVYLLDGTMEVVLTEKDVFIERLVCEKLGDDAARFISDYIEEIAEDAKYTQEARQDAEKKQPTATSPSARVPSLR